MLRPTRVALVWVTAAAAGGAWGWATGYALSCKWERPSPGGPLPLTGSVLAGCGNAVRAILLQGGGGLIGGATGLVVGVLATGRRAASRATPTGGEEAGRE